MGIVMRIGLEMQMIGGEPRAMCSLLVWEPYLGIARDNPPLQGPQWRLNTWQQAMEQWRQYG